MLNDDVIAFLRSRPIALLCTRDGENHPSLHEAFLAEVTADHLLVLVPAHVARNLAENVADNGDAAILVSRQPGDHRSIQVKGRLTDLEDARPHPEVDALRGPLMEVFLAFATDEEAREGFDLLRGVPMVQARLEVRQMFDQTPGPGAGRRIGDAP